MYSIQIGFSIHSSLSFNIKMINDKDAVRRCSSQFILIAVYQTITDEFLRILIVIHYKDALMSSFYGSQKSDNLKAQLGHENDK